MDDNNILIIVRGIDEEYSTWYPEDIASVADTYVLDDISELLDKGKRHFGKTDCMLQVGENGLWFNKIILQNNPYCRSGFTAFSIYVPYKCKVPGMILNSVMDELYKSYMGLAGVEPSRIDWSFVNAAVDKLKKAAVGCKETLKVSKNIDSYAYVDTKEDIVAFLDMPFQQEYASYEGVFFSRGILDKKGTFIRLSMDFNKLETPMDEVAVNDGGPAKIRRELRELVEYNLVYDPKYKKRLVCYVDDVETKFYFDKVVCQKGSEFKFADRKGLCEFMFEINDDNVIEIQAQEFDPSVSETANTSSRKKLALILALVAVIVGAFFMFGSQFMKKDLFAEARSCYNDDAWNLNKMTYYMAKIKAYMKNNELNADNLDEFHKRIYDELDANITFKYNLNNMNVATGQQQLSHLKDHESITSNLSDAKRNLLVSMGSDVDKLAGFYSENQNVIADMKFSELNKLWNNFQLVDYRVKAAKQCCSDDSWSLEMMNSCKNDLDVLRQERQLSADEQAVYTELNANIRFRSGLNNNEWAIGNESENPLNGLKSDANIVDNLPSERRKLLESMGNDKDKFDGFFNANKALALMKFSEIKNKWELFTVKKAEVTASTPEPTQVAATTPKTGTKTPSSPSAASSAKTPTSTPAPKSVNVNTSHRESKGSSAEGAICNKLQSYETLMSFPSTSLWNELSALQKVQVNTIRDLVRQKKVSSSDYERIVKAYNKKGSSLKGLYNEVFEFVMQQ